MTLSRLTLKDVVYDHFFLGACVLALPVWLIIYFTQTLLLPGRDFTWSQLLMLGLVFPVLEELAFRGLLQGYLLRIPALALRSIGVTGANGVTSLLFTVLHLFHQPPGVVALIFFPSLIFGELRERFGSTHPSIMMHVYYNLGLLLVLMAKPG
jgi:membrane protease YdiL (CAAX protease family)